MPTVRWIDGKDYEVSEVLPPAPPPPPPPPPPPSGYVHGASLTRDMVGVRPGVTLKSQGKTTITKAGSVVENIQFTGQLLIDAPDVTVRNCRWDGVNVGDQALVKITQSEHARVLVEYCEATGGSWTNFVSGSQYAAVLNFIDGSRGDAFRIGSMGHATIENNWAQNFVSSSAHSDFVQCYMNHAEPYPASTHGNVIRGNRVEMKPYGDSWTFHVESSLIEGNLFIGGGDIDIGIRQDDTPEMIIRDNVFDSDKPLAEKGTRYVWEDNTYADGTPAPRPK